VFIRRCIKKRWCMSLVFVKGLTLLEVCSKYAADSTSGAFLDDLRCAIATVCFVIVCLDAILFPTNSICHGH